MPYFFFRPPESESGPGPSDSAALASTVSVNQKPSGGTDYPFIKPSADIQELLGDLYLAFRDEGVTYPLAVKWLYGMGTASSAHPEGISEPTHARDLVIVDANDMLVFDSTTATYSSSTWGTNLLIAQWVGASSVCRYTAFTSIVSSDYPTNITPDDGRLDPRTCQPDAPRLNSITVNETTLAPGGIDLVNGYNITITQGVVGAVPTLPGATQSTDGTRPVTKITISAVPGSGAGTAPGCPDGPGPVLTIGGASPDDSGNLLLDATGCLRVQLPTRLTGTMKERLAEVLDPGTLAVQSDCEPCCPCAYFARTYTGVAKLWTSGQALATSAQNARDTYADNIARWNAQKTCREASTIRIVQLPERGCRATIGVSFCNTTQLCLTPLVLRFTFETWKGGIDVTGVYTGVLQQPAYLSGSATGGTVQATLSGAWPVYEAYFDYANPGSITSVQFRLSIPNCAGVTLYTTVTVHTPVALPTVDIPSDIAALWTPVPPKYLARFLKEQLTPYDPTDRFL